MNFMEKITEKTLGHPQPDPKLSLQTQKIGADSTSIRSLDWNRSRFDIEFGLRNGTTYNSFLIEGNKIALIDTSHKKFKEIWLERIKSIVNIQSIDYLIVSHTEPDHSGLISDLLDINPEIEIIASKIGIQFLENQVHKSFKSRSVKTGDILDLGKNTNSGVEHSIEFITAPNLHWPDTIFSFDHGTYTLYTCDAFGLHYCSDEHFDIDEKLILPDFRFYYDCLMAPNARSVLQAIKRIDKLPKINTIAVGHGPLLKHHLKEWKNKYFEWSGQISKGSDYIAICYISLYGYCDQLSQSIAHGVGKTNVQVQLIDLKATDSQELSALINEAKAVIIPTWPNEPEIELQNSVNTLIAALNKKQWIAFYDAYGGNDQPIDTISSQLLRLCNKEAFSPLRVKQTPDSNIFQKFEEAGTDLGQLINKKQAIATMKSLDGELDKALGRISGGLYIVTASQGSNGQTRRSAMVASWISQASFEPPGVTIGVAKDRAIEALLQVEDCFVINVLKQDNYQGLMRHFLKRFPPGADRFKGINLLDNLAKGGPVLIDSLAYLDCKVVSRLEVNDHWIIYAEVLEGNVSDIEAKTAIHHRLVGNHY